MLAGLVQPVQFPALVKHRGLWRIQILGLVVAKHSATKAQDAPAQVADGEHQALAEAVVMARARVSGNGQAGVYQRRDLGEGAFGREFA